MIDKIRDGVARDILRAKGDRAVFGALVSTAASALQRGWSYTEWAGLVLEAASHLGNQARLKNGKERGALRTEKFLTQAWETAQTWLATQAEPRLDRDQMRAEAERRRDQMMLVVADPDNGLQDNDRAVLAYVSNLAAERGTYKVAISRTKLKEDLDINQTAGRNSLQRLCAQGYLELVEKGRPGGERTRRRRANAYSVASQLPATATSPIPETGMWCPPAITSGAPSPEAPGALVVISGAPSASPSKEERSMITLTCTPEGDITVTLPDATSKEVIEALRAKSISVVVDPEAHFDNVTDIRTRRS